MALEERHSERFDDIGRVEIPELCGISATLENISKDGCKIHYSFPVVVDLENDYEIKITLARIANEGALSLICRPVWAKEVSGSTEIGFKFLHSLDSVKLNEYMIQLCDDFSDENIKNQIRSAQHRAILNANKEMLWCCVFRFSRNARNVKV